MTERIQLHRLTGDKFKDIVPNSDHYEALAASSTILATAIAYIIDNHSSLFTMLVQSEPTRKWTPIKDTNPFSCPLPILFKRNASDAVIVLQLDKIHCLEVMSISKRSREEWRISELITDTVCDGCGSYLFEYDDLYWVLGDHYCFDCKVDMYPTDRDWNCALIQGSIEISDKKLAAMTDAKIAELVEEVFNDDSETYFTTA